MLKRLTCWETRSNLHLLLFFAMQGALVWAVSPLHVRLFLWASSTGVCQSSEKRRMSAVRTVLPYNPNTSDVLAGNELWQLNITVQICFQARVKLSPFKMKAVYLDMMRLWGDRHTLGRVDAWLLINWLDCISAGKMGSVRTPPFEYSVSITTTQGHTVLGSQSKSIKA